VEAIGGDCVRLYLAIESNGVWEDRGFVEMPAMGVLRSSPFVLQSTLDITNCAEESSTREKVLTH
jgi:hypothetical protein